jgi:photosystem II stability/assembly factor-like uncharacterized protein
MYWLAYGFAIAGLAICLTDGAQAQIVNSRTIAALEWRHIGPFRGGRITTVTGVPSQPYTFYMGAPGGGVWRTSDAGASWQNLSDGWFNTGSVGAIDVSLSDPNVIYVGMGEHCVRDVTVSHGDGIYKSTDSGKTWRHLGLPDTRHISSVVIHPADPDIVYVGAQGSPWNAHPERGVYRSTDGGETWSLLLHSNENSGVNDLVMDPNNPRILYAALWEHRRRPWHGYQLNSGGPGSALYKSTDGGDSWQRLSAGLPEPAGKFGIAVSPADSERLYALVEARQGESGLYVSNDAGQSWDHVNSEHVLTQRSAYYMHIVADTQDRETVYVLNAPFLKSIDGGKAFERLQTPHGDSHDLWIHPERSDWMIEANDGGANISYNGGRTWSTQGNQPTAQFYRVSVDNEFPYNLYAGQQDNTTVKIQSRTFGSGIGDKHWYPVGGGESAHVAFDPDQPDLIYAGNYQGQITEFNDRNRLTRDVRRYPLGAAYRSPEEYPYRFNWNAPILVSRHDPSVIYHAAQVLLKSTDRGHSWREISPDLTRNEKQKQGIVEGEFTVEGTAGAMYNTIFYVSQSPHAAGELWVGTDDGLIHLTRDGGKNWQPITPRGLPESQINMIEVSPHRPGKAYAVTTRYKFGELSPGIYRTEDFGRSWTRIVEDIPANDWIRVVREDPEREGLLYAGSQTSMYVSLDDGQSWQSLQLNLPHVPVTDLQVHRNDLVAATEGRAFWILDDLSVLRQIDGNIAAAEFHLFQPAEFVRVDVAGFGGPSGPGENPPPGTLVHYLLDEAADDSRPVLLEVLSVEGEILNTFRSGDEEASLPAKAGLNRFVWDWYVAPLENGPGLETWRGPLSYRVLPGTYTVRLTIGESSSTRDFAVLPDPRTPVSSADAEEKLELLEALYAETDEVLRSVASLRLVREQVSQLEKMMSEADRERIADERQALRRRIGDWLDAVVEDSDEHFIDAQHSPSRLDFSMLEVMSMVDGMAPPLTQGMMSRVSDVRARWSGQRDAWQGILDNELARFNRAIGALAMPALAVEKRRSGSE